MMMLMEHQPSSLHLRQRLLILACLVVSNTLVPILFSQVVVVQAGLIEDERVAEYHNREHKWPPLHEEFVPNTNGWRKIMRRRLEQVQRIEDRGDMYNGEFKVHEI